MTQYIPRATYPTNVALTLTTHQKNSLELSYRWHVAYIQTQSNMEHMRARARARAHTHPHTPTPTPTK